MKPWAHLLVSAVLAAVLYPAFSWKVLFIFIGGSLIDFDHYLWYIYKYRNLDFLKAYKFYIERFDRVKIKDIIGSLLVFHTIEFLLAMAVLSFYLESAFIATIGLVSHYLVDCIYLYSVPKRLIANHSIISWVIKNKIQKV